MRKRVFVLFASLLILTLGASCKKETGDRKKIVVGASTTPHAEILQAAGGILEKKGYTLIIKEFEDYVQPNLTLANKELDANYFQHKPYLDDFNQENKMNLVCAAAIHYEPLGIYAGKTQSLKELQKGAKIAVPNDTTNEARALLLLEANGLIHLDPNAGLKATVKDILENPKNLKIMELEAAQLARSLPDLDFAVINGNYAIKAGLNAAEDAIATESKDSLAAETFANIIAIRQGEENEEKIIALIDALKSDTVKNYIEQTYQGAVVPVF